MPIVGTVTISSGIVNRRERRMTREAKKPSRASRKKPAWQDNVAWLNILQSEKGFGLKNGAEVADFLDTTVSAVSLVRHGERDLAGLAPAVLALLFPDDFEIALQAQLMECDLRKLHAQMTNDLAEGKTPEASREALQKRIAEGWNLLARLRRCYNRITWRAAEQRFERAIVRAAIASLEGQLNLYCGRYEAAAAAFERSLSRLKEAFSEKAPPAQDKMARLGARVLLVRSMINWYFANHKAEPKVDVSQTLTQEDFVRVVRDVAVIVGDSRLLINVGEAHAEHDMDDLAAELLCDAAEILDIKAADLPQHHPVGYETSLGMIPVLATALNLANQVEARRRDALEKKLAARCDVGGFPLGSLPDDASLNLPGF
ncbi:hypothetical protein ACD578_25710 [Microvirga sp. RSM25]|uniref:hypothetical protein n=1 Tax=Microvirga sp. RSM25 TaxID=3273802 RepID=UPI00384BFD19